jgi:hypothetical protein
MIGRRCARFGKGLAHQHSDHGAKAFCLGIAAPTIYMVRMRRLGTVDHPREVA